MKVIIVDDEPKVLRGMRSVIERECPDIEVAGQFEDGQSALDALESLRPSVVITDIKMPRMTGLELAAEALERFPAIKFILLTGYADFEYARQALRFKVIDYFLKPPDYRKILERLRELQAEGETAPPETERPIKRKIISDVREYIQGHYFEDVTLHSLSSRYFMNESYLSELFKKETGDNFQSFLTRVRMERAKELLGHMDLKIYQIAEMVGYGSAQYFFRVFKQQFGLTPDEYRQQNAR